MYRRYLVPEPTRLEEGDDQEIYEVEKFQRWRYREFLVLWKVYPIEEAMLRSRQAVQRGPKWTKERRHGPQMKITK